MAEDDKNEVSNEAEKVDKPAPAKKKAVRKKVPAKKATTKKKVAAKKKAAPKKKAARKRSLSPKQKTPVNEGTIAAEATTLKASEQAPEKTAEGESPIVVATAAAEIDNSAAESAPSIVPETVDVVANQSTETVSTITDQTKPEDAAANAPETQIETTAPKQNEKVQKRLEEMGLMPSDSTDKQAPPPPPPANTGLGFWQKSFIWTIVVVAGLLYFRNVTNNGDLDQPELATTTHQAETPNETQKAALTPASDDDTSHSVSSEDTTLPVSADSTAPIASPDQTAQNLQQAQNDDAVAEKGAPADSAAEVDQQTSTEESTTAEPIASSDSDTERSTQIAVKEDTEIPSSEVETVIEEKSPSLVETFTSFIKGDKTEEKVADQVMEQGADAATQAIISQDPVASGMATANEMAGTVMTEVKKATMPNGASSDSQEGEVESSTTNTEQASTESNQTTPAAASASVSDSESSTAAAPSATTAGADTGASAAEEKSEQKTAPRGPLSAMPRMMTGMIPNFQSNRGIQSNPGKAINPNESRRTRQGAAPYKRFGYPRIKPNRDANNNQAQMVPRQRTVPVAPVYPRYTAPRYPHPYTQRPVSPYYTPYTVRPPVYGPAVRYPYPQPVPPPVR